MSRPPARLRQNLRELLWRPLHERRARAVDTTRIGTLCLGLGPNRNMTTLTGSLIALHPQCQVMNHGWRRERGRGTALLREPSAANTERFLRWALRASQGGRQGPYGGSITHSHAFKRAAMAQAYRRRYGDAVLKRDIRCVFWKSSKQVTRFVRDEGIDLGDVVTRNPRLRFLMPLRNPLDCGLSNVRKGHHKHFVHLRGASVAQVVDFMVELVAWFVELQARHPQHFFSYLEDDFGPAMLADLARFLRVEPDERWIQDCLPSAPRGSRYEYEPELLDAYHASLERHLAARPDLQERFARTATR